MKRREALATIGTVPLGGILAACGGEPGDATELTTTEGTTATIEPSGGSGASGSGLARRFDRSASCELSAELAEGPFYFDVDSIRSDITEDRDGTPLRLGLRVLDAEACAPIEGAVVDVWHCDALGVYSGFEAASTAAGAGAPGAGADPVEQGGTFLRGAQVTDGGGIAVFRTIYPGWYPGRTVHIHAKVHLDQDTLVTTQLFFDEGLTDQVFRSEPYASRPDRSTRNDSDGIFDPALVLTAWRERNGVLGLLNLTVARA